jgi:hypothetical protein
MVIEDQFGDVQRSSLALVLPGPVLACPPGADDNA